MKKTLIASFAIVAAVVTGSAQGAKADSGATNITKGVFSPTHASTAPAATAGDATCNALSRACDGHYRADDAAKSTRLMAVAGATTITKGNVSSVAFDDGELADSDETRDYEIEVL